MDSAVFFFFAAEVMLWGASGRRRAPLFHVAPQLDPRPAGHRRGGHRRGGVRAARRAGRDGGRGDPRRGGGRRPGLQAHLDRAGPQGAGRRHPRRGDLGPGAPARRGGHQRAGARALRPRAARRPRRGGPQEVRLPERPRRDGRQAGHPAPQDPEAREDRVPGRRRRRGLPGRGGEHRGEVPQRRQPARPPQEVPGLQLRAAQGLPDPRPCECDSSGGFPKDVRRRGSRSFIDEMAPTE